VQYAPINGDGSLGVFMDSTAFTTARGGLTMASANGYLYTLGGCSSGFDLFNGTCSGSKLNDVQYTKISTAGEPSQAKTLSGTMNVARFGHASVAYNGYVYAIGGCSGGATCFTSSANWRTDISYAKLNSDGTLANCGAGAGNWCTDNSRPLPSTGSCLGNGGRFGISGAVYNGNIYITGGYAVSGILCTNITLTGEVLIGRLSGGSNADAGGALAANWSLMGNGITARYSHASLVYGNKLYVIGGLDGSANPISSVQVNTITGDGLVAAGWTTTTALNAAVGESVAMVHKGRIVVAGGKIAGGAATGNIQISAPISSTGTITGWTTDSTHTITARRLHGGVSVNGYLYVVGGYNGTNYLNSIQYTTMDDSGNLANWTTASATLSTARGAYDNVVSTQGFIIALGGCGAGLCTSFLNNSEYFAVNNGGMGRNGAFKNDSSYTTNTQGQEMVVLNGYLYQLGGCTAWNASNWCTSTVNTVRYAALNADGSIGTWNTTNAFTTARLAPGAFTFNGYLYVAGGCNVQNTTNGTCTTAQTDIQYAKPNADGTIPASGAGSWTTASTSLVAYDASEGLAVYDGYLYAIRQTTATVNPSHVYYIQIQSNGNITGSWTQSSNELLKFTIGANTVAYNGYLYYIAGSDNSGTTAAQSVVQFAKINADHTVGTWSYTSFLDYASASPSSFAYNGYMYSYGGWNTGNGGGFSSTCYSNLTAAPILSDGSLGEWYHIFQNSNHPGSSPTAVAYNGWTYNTGGGCGSFSANVDNIVYRAPLATIPRVGHYSRLHDFDKDVVLTQMLFNGSLGTISGNENLVYHTAQSAANVFGNPTTISSLPWLTLQTINSLDGSGNPMGYARELWLKFTIDDRYGAAFPDNVANASSLDEYIIYFRSNPGQRLRGGKTFTSGAVTGLDAQP
jgi:hypothetical protein